MSPNERFREALLRKGISQAELARRLGIPHGTVNSWMTGRCRVPRSGERLRALLEALDLSLETMLGEEELPENDWWETIWNERQVTYRDHPLPRRSDLPLRFRRERPVRTGSCVVNRWLHPAVQLNVGTAEPDEVWERVEQKLRRRKLQDDDVRIFWIEEELLIFPQSADVLRALVRPLWTGEVETKDRRRKEFRHLRETV